MSREDILALGKRAKQKMTRRSFTVSRKLAGRGGDSFLSISVGMEEDSSPAECRAAYLLAFLECNETVVRAARAGSLITDDEMHQALKVLRHNFSKMLADGLDKEA